MLHPAAHLLRLVGILVALAVLVTAGSIAAQKRELRICADPDNLPFSNQKLEGFENKLAELLAREMDATLTYTWKPQRRGYIRRTLESKACDVIPGFPDGSEMLLTTKPYYRSTYVFVYAKDKNLQIRSFDDPALRRLRVGLHAIGEDGANPPPAHALGRRGITKNIVGFNMLDVETVQNPQGRIIEAVAAGEIDVAIVWGPLGGYFAKQQKSDLEVVPVSPAIEPSGIPFTFDISMGVRPGDTALKTELERILDRRRPEVLRVLQEFGVPLVVTDGESR
jgi:mxaJ protein